MLMALYLVCLFAFSRIISAQTNYPFQEWMSSFPSSANFYDNTIFDIILPGSRSSGMIYESISNIPSNVSSTFDYSRIVSLSLQDQKLWSSRQHSSILNQLRLGCRFLDLQIEENNNNFYAYNALLATNINSIINDIDAFISTYGPNEIIILYFNSFSVNNLQAFYDIFTNSALNTKMVSNTIPLTTETLQNIIDSGKNIIAFTDDLSVTNPPNTFFNSNTFLYITTSTSDTNLTLGYMDEINEVQTFVTSNLRYGWPSNTLNLIYWTLDISPIGDLNQFTTYSSFHQYNIPLAFQLNVMISNYNKLRFGNVLLVDFIDSSDVVEQAIILNYEHFQCRDLIWNNGITGCPAQSSLQTNFKYNDPSQICNTLNLNTDCPKSCGVCTVSTNIPKSTCTATADCDSPLYASYSSNSIATSQCFLRKDNQDQYIKKASFCSALNTYDSCGNYDGANICGDMMTDIVSQCDHFCTADYQCMDGYCNRGYSICMTLNPSNITSTMSATNNLQRYDGINSNVATQYRSDVAALRPGNPDGNYPNDARSFDDLNADPYFTSVLGLLILIVILATFFCVCFTICCGFECFCNKRCKSCCTVLTHDIKRKTICICVCYTIIIIIILAFAIEGIVSNQAIHSHIFDESSDDSFISASNRLFYDVSDKFGSASNLTQFITDNIDEILPRVDNTIQNDGSIDQMHDDINEMYRILNVMYSEYRNGVSLSGNVTNPFNGSNINNYTIDCEYCDTIPGTILSVNDTIQSEATDSLNDIESALDTTQDLVDETRNIKDATRQFQNSVDKILDMSNNTQIHYNQYMNAAETYDNDRQIYVTLFLSLIICIFIIIPIIGIVRSSKCCFKINWCLAMFCTVLLLLISVPFIFSITLSADLCVRLDEFEAALPNAMHTKLGRDVFNNSLLNDMRDRDHDNTTVNAQDTLNAIDTCFDGGSLLTVFNLSYILDWAAYRKQLDDALNIDVVDFFVIDELETFQTEINTLSIEEYRTGITGLIAEVNAISGCYCVVNGVAFDWQNLDPGTDCTAVGYSPSVAADDYWSNTSWTQRKDCKDKFKVASYGVQVWNKNAPEAVIKINRLKRDAKDIFMAKDSVYVTANELIGALQNISCVVGTLLDDFDQMLNEFTNCGFLGERYGDFKHVGCVVIFDDLYKVGRALIIIAFMFLFIILFSLCLDYIYSTCMVPVDKPIYKENSEFAEGVTGSAVQMTNTPLSDTKSAEFDRAASASPGSVAGDGDFVTCEQKEEPVLPKEEPVVPMDDSYEFKDDVNITGNDVLLFEDCDTVVIHDDAYQD